MLMLQGWNSPRPERDGNVGCIPLGPLNFWWLGVLSQTNGVMGMCDRPREEVEAGTRRSN